MIERRFAVSIAVPCVFRRTLNQIQNRTHLTLVLNHGQNKLFPVLS